MKKLSLLIALCMLISIGGVYAAWTYPGETMETQTEPFVNKMGDLSHTGSAGRYTFTNNSIDFSIEPDTQENKLTTIKWGNGQVTLTFYAEDNISTDALNAALNATISIVNTSSTLGTFTDPVTHQTDSIYDLDLTKTITLQRADWTTQDNKVYTCTITAERLDALDAVSINQFALPTQDDYEAFRTANAAVRLALKVTAAAIPQSGN